MQENTSSSKKHYLSKMDLVKISLADLPEVMLSWLVELLAEEGAELILLEVGEGGGGRPAWKRRERLE